VADARAEGASGGCEDAAQIAVLPSPLAPWKGAVAHPHRRGEAARGRAFADRARRQRRGPNRASGTAGPPYFWFAEVAAPAAGDVACDAGGRTARRPGAGTITRDIAVSAGKPPGPPAAEGSICSCAIHGAARRETCIRHGSRSCSMRRSNAEPSWKAWHEVCCATGRANILFNYLGLNEDNVALSLRPDCADFVYFLRAYFAFKMGCRSATRIARAAPPARPPKCYQWFDILHPAVTRPAPRPTGRRRSGRGPAPAKPSALAQLFSPAPPTPPPQPAAARLRRRRSRRSANICGPSATSSIPGPCACRRATTTPIFIPCR